MPRRSDKTDKWSDRIRIDPSIAAGASSTEACADGIRRAILSGDVAPGTRLPPERDLATQLGVNRSTLRAALARLATERLVRIRQGSGCVVRDFTREAGPDILVDLAELGDGSAREVAADLLHVRRHLARAVIERLPARLPTVARVRLEAEIERLERLVDADADARAIADQDVVVISAFVGATGSRVLQLCLNPLIAFPRSMPLLCDAIYADARSTLAVHRAIFAWATTPRRPPPDAVVAAFEARDRLTLRRLERLARRTRAREVS